MQNRRSAESLSTTIDTSTAAVTALLDGVTPGPWAPIGAADSDTEFLSAARHLVPALLAERDKLRDAAVARAAELEAEVERLRVALGAEQDSADEIADVLSQCGDGLMFDVERLQAALDQHDALREAALSSIPMPTDAAATLDRLTAQARAAGMREAAEIVSEHEEVELLSTLARGLQTRSAGNRAGMAFAEAISSRADEIEKGAAR